MVDRRFSGRNKSDFVSNQEQAATATGKSFSRLESFQNDTVFVYQSSLHGLHTFARHEKNYTATKRTNAIKDQKEKEFAAS